MAQNRRNSRKITRRQGQAIICLLTNPSVHTAAQAAGIGDRTLWRWLKQENFQSAYREARREVVQQAISHLQNGMCKAADVLIEIMESKKAPTSSRVNAAKAMLDLGLKSLETEDLAVRIKALEDQIERLSI